MQKGILSFDRIDLYQALNLKAARMKPISVENITIISPKLETAGLILLSPYRIVKKQKKAISRLNDLLKQGGKALAIEGFSVSNEHKGLISIGSIIWGRDQKQETSDFQVMNIEFYRQR